MTRLALQNLTVDDFAELNSGLKELKKLKPHNWRQYIQVFIDEARRTGADELEPIGRGFESLGTYELYKNGKSLGAVIRIQNGGLPMPEKRYRGLMPFYFEQVYEFPGDEHPVLTPESDIGSPYGVRINVLPKARTLPKLADEYGIPNDSIEDFDEWLHLCTKVDQQINSLLNYQGQPLVDSHPGNIGFYVTKNSMYIPTVFDPGSAPMYRYPATVWPGGQSDRNRTVGILRRQTKGEAIWMKEDVWDHLRQEVAEDARRLYAGEPTRYAQRLEELPEIIPIEAIRACTSKISTTPDTGIVR